MTPSTVSGICQYNQWHYWIGILFVTTLKKILTLKIRSGETLQTKKRMLSEHNTFA